MSDFRDDFSPAPIAPQITQEEVLDAVDIQEDKQLADAYFHPAWGKVEEIIINACEDLKSIASVNQDLPADQFTIEAKANIKAVAILSGVWGKIKDAVESVESIERTTKGNK